MRILILTPQLPYPPHQGTSLRNFHIIRGLAPHHEIHLLSFLEDDQSARRSAIRPLAALCATMTTVPVPGRTAGQRLSRLLGRPDPDMAHRLESERFDEALAQQLRRPFDVVQVEGIELARVIPTVRRLAPTARVVFDDHNAEAALQESAWRTDLRQPGRWHAAAYSWLQARRLRRFEAWACRSADAVTVVSDADRAALRALLAATPAPAGRGAGPIVTIPNCIDVEAYARPPEGPLPRYDLLFTGKMDYRPNVDAMLWFGREIWPLVRAAHPGATWAVVGQKPHPRLDWLRGEPGVTVTGRVPHIQPYLAGAALYVMPLRMGSGTRLKLIEAMAAGKAIVATPFGVEGFPVAEGDQVALAGTAEAFAAAVNRLLDAPAERERLGTAARAFAGRYDWRRVIPRFAELYRSLG